MFTETELNTKITFNRKIVRLRREDKRILLYTTDPDYRISGKMLFLAPPSAIFLGLCNGRRTQQEVLEAVSYIFDLPSIESARLAAQQMVEFLVQNVGPEIFLDPSFVNDSFFGKEYDTLDFVIDARKVDLRGGRLDAPLDLIYIVTQACFRKCRYCYAETIEAPEFELLPVERFAELMQEAHSLQINSIVFGGGEPFCRKDILRLIRLAIDADICPFLSTKAYLSKAVCNELKDMNLPFIQVSIDSHREHIADFLTGSKGYFQQIMKTIQNLREVQIPIRAKAVLTPFNTFDVPELLNLLSALGVNKFHFVRYGRSAFRHSDSLFADDDALKYVRDAIELFKSQHPEVRIDYNFGGNNTFDERSKVDRAKRFSERAVCSVGRFALTILPDGRAFVCEQLPTRDEFCFGDLKKQSIKEVWNSDELRKVVMPPRDYFRGQVCFDCELFEECHTIKGRCMRNAFILYGNAYAPDPLCPKAPPAPRQE